MKKIMQQVMNQVADLKADADLILSTSKSLKMSAQNGAISEYKVSSSQILGIRVIKNGAVGISYTEALDNDSLKYMVTQAIQNAESNEANQNEKILELEGSVADEMSYSEKETDISIKTQKALELESNVKARESRVVAVPYNSYNENEYKSLFLTSKGRSTSYADKTYSITSSALLDENGKKAIYYDYDLSHTFDQLKWNKVVETSLFHARNILGEKTLATGKYNVRFSTDSLKDLIECFSNFYSAKSAMDKVNPWSAKMGEQVISADLSIEDAPAYAQAFRASKFDSEGVLRKPLALVTDGTLKSFLHNSVTANYFKTITTGHASRGASSSLNVSGTHFLIQGKNTKPLPPKFMEVIQMDGLHSGANRVTGNFSVAVKGYLWENGQKVMTFGNITLSGNLIELLKNVEVVGSDMEASTDLSFFSVPLMFNDLSIAGT
ncbi:MAG: TldD/PmbA family protein [Bdellovibrionales bacterium]|nr:TldD/PmbA family protein [Bdellovibrionales bacterium]